MLKKKIQKNLKGKRKKQRKKKKVFWSRNAGKHPTKKRCILLFLSWDFWRCSFLCWAVKALWEAGGCATLGCCTAQLWDPFPWYLQELIRGNKTHFKTLNCPNKQKKKITVIPLLDTPWPQPPSLSQMSPIISTQEGFEQQKFIFKPLSQP